MRKNENFKWVQQKDAMLCGVACLEMLCTSMGRKISQTYLNELCHPTSDGVSLQGLADAGEKMGLKSYAGYITLKELSQTDTPCILHWNQIHFVVLYNVDRGGTRFWVADPGKGKYKLSLEEFKKHRVTISSKGEYKGIAMFFEPDDRFYNFSVEVEQEKRSFQSYLYDEEYGDYVLDYYGIRDWVESLPKRSISMMILQNYTIIGL